MDAAEILGLTENNGDGAASGKENTAPSDAEPGVPAYAPFQSTFTSVSMHKSDRIRLLNFPTDITDTIRQAIVTSWPRGVQSERPYGGSHEFHLRGYPWASSGNDAIHARRLVRTILEDLAKRGWMLSLSTDVSRKSTDKDTLVFRHQNPAPQPMTWMCVTFSLFNELRSIDAPPDLVTDGVQALAPHVESHKTKDQPGVYQLTLRGHPWSADGTATMEARQILLSLLQVLELHGFTVYASIDQKAAETGSTDTWYVCRQVSWIRGMPVFHK